MFQYNEYIQVMASNQYLCQDMEEQGIFHVIKVHKKIKNVAVI